MDVEAEGVILRPVVIMIIVVGMGIIGIIVMPSLVVVVVVVGEEDGEAEVLHSHRRRIGDKWRKSPHDLRVSVKHTPSMRWIDDCNVPSTHGHHR